MCASVAHANYKYIYRYIIFLFVLTYDKLDLMAIKINYGFQKISLKSAKHLA
jgi:hypothetical protein